MAVAKPGLSMIVTSAETAAGRGGGVFRKSASVLMILAFVFAAPSLQTFAHDIIAKTASGRSLVLLQVEKDAGSLVITCKDSGLTLNDPVVALTGLDELEDLRELRFYHVPQISSYSFLTACKSLEKLIISFGRVRSLEFLSGMADLKVLHLEFCDDWESEYGLPFAVYPIDLSENPRLEYLAFRVCSLKHLPVLENVPESLMFADFSYNPLMIGEGDIDALHALRNLRGIYLAGASASGRVIKNYKNLVFDDAGPLLSEYIGE